MLSNTRQHEEQEGGRQLNPSPYLEKIAANLDKFPGLTITIVFIQPRQGVENFKCCNFKKRCHILHDLIKAGSEEGGEEN